MQVNVELSRRPLEGATAHGLARPQAPGESGAIEEEEKEKTTNQQPSVFVSGP